MSQLRGLPQRERDRLLGLYRSLVVPGDVPPKYHVKRFKIGWIAATWTDETPRSLDNYTLHRHLLGNLMVAARWHPSDLVSCIVFDIDVARTRFSPRARTGCVLDSVRKRLDALRRALAPCELQAIRSSGSGGVHAYLFLTKPRRGDVVRSVVIERLCAASIKIRPGQLEVWPANQVLRLPLGQGSYLLAADMTPICATVKAQGVFRNVPASIDHLASFKRRHAVSLDSLRVSTTPSLRVDQDSSGKIERSTPRKPSRQRRRGSSVRPPTMSHHDDTEVSFRDDIEASHDGISEYGARYRQASRRVYWLRVTRGLAPDETLQEFERWLRTGSHTSKDLESDRRAEVIRGMLRDAGSYIAQLNRRIASGDLTPGTGGRMAMSALVNHLRGEHGRGWREVARAALTVKDIEAVQHLPANVRPSVEVVHGLLRMAAARFGKSTFQISMAARTLQTIAGGRTRPVVDAEGRRVRQLAVSAYKGVLRILERLGVASLTTDAQLGKRARIFEITLPS